jgi:ankyrin repeat protein
MLLAIENINVNQQNKDGNTALMWASHQGHQEIVQILLNKENINVNQQDKDGFTALMWACMKGQKEIVQMFLEFILKN